MLITIELSIYVVHLRKRKAKHGKLKSPSTSSITYWQIEKHMECLSGTVNTCKINNVAFCFQHSLLLCTFMHMHACTCKHYTST